MQVSNPHIQEFFSFNESLSIKIIIEVLKDIISKYSLEKKQVISLTTSEESFNDLTFEEFEKLFQTHKDESNIAQIYLSDNGHSMSIIFQFKNNNVGPNGNFTIMLGDKALNREVREILWNRLNLKKQNFSFQQSEEDSMTVSPIFRGRNFKKKEKNCFVLMPFTEVWSNRIWRHLKKIVENERYTCIRADDLFGQNILDDIWKGINEASVIIADITTRNPNVFYEIGISHTIGKKVILLSQSLADIPFDFNQYRHLIYEDNTDGIEKMQKNLPKYLNEH